MLPEPRTPQVCPKKRREKGGKKWGKTLVTQCSRVAAGLHCTHLLNNNIYAELQAKVRTKYRDINFFILAVLCQSLLFAIDLFLMQRPEADSCHRWPVQRGPTEPQLADSAFILCRFILFYFIYFLLNIAKVCLKAFSSLLFCQCLSFHFYFYFIFGKVFASILWRIDNRFDFALHILSV